MILKPQVVLLFAAMALGACVWTGCAVAPRPAGDAVRANGPYAGAAACAECHQEVAERQSRSPHARTLQPVTPEWETAHIRSEQRILDPETGLAYGFERRDGGIHQVVRENGREVASAAVQYLLGSGHHGVSLVTRDRTGWRYLSLTYYAHQGWDFSPMHMIGDAVARRQNAAGWPVSVDELKRCYTCHSTQLEFQGDSLDAGRTELGVRCEACHGPGRAHIEAARAKQPDLKINRLGKWPAKSFMAMCQQCHNETSTVDGVVRGISDDPNDPATVKYHVHGLEQSRCYTRSQDAMRCTTCHDPHSGTENTPSFYETRCLSCHQQRKVTACPVSPKSGCLPCHMPKVEVEKHTLFADHWIRAKSPFAPKSGSKRASSPSTTAQHP